jgi:hypothetical protein
VFTQNDSSGFSSWLVLVIDPGLFLFWRLHPSRAERLLGFSPSQRQLVAAHYQFEKTVNGFVAGFKAVLLFQASRYL